MSPSPLGPAAVGHARPPRRPGRRRRLLPAVLRAHRGQPAPGARAARSARGPGRAGGRRRARRGDGDRRAVARAIGAGQARHADRRRTVARVRRRGARGRPAGARGGARRRRRRLAPIAPGTSSSRADLLRGDDPIGFTHPLLRAAVHAGLPAGERGRMHRRAALLLSEGAAGRRSASARICSSRPRRRTAPSSSCSARRRARRLGVGRPHRPPTTWIARCASRRPPTRGRRCSRSSDAPRRRRAGRPPRSTCAPRWRRPSRGPERLALLLDLGRALQHAGDMPGATATFLRGLEEVRPGAGELAADLEAGYLAAAMHAPEPARPRRIAART